MAVAMRLSRGGRKSRPFYRIVVADKRMPRDGRYIERLGSYNPLLANDDENRVILNEERIKYWLAEGAEPSERVAKFLGKAGLAPMPAISERPNKSAPSDNTVERKREKEEKQKAAEEAAKAAAEEKAAEAAAPAPAEEPAAVEAPEADKVEEAKAEDAAPAEEAKAEEKKED